MGKARTAESALEAEIEGLAKQHEDSKALAASLNDQINALAVKRDTAELKAATTAVSIQQRQYALAVITGSTPEVSDEPIESHHIAVDGHPAYEGGNSPEVAALVAAAHDGEEDDAPPKGTRKRGDPDAPTVQPLPPGQNPEQMLAKLRDQEEGVPVEG
jgi:hypothetical protein